MGHNTSAKTTTQLRKEIARLQRELAGLRQHNPTDTVFAPPSPSDQEHIITHLQDAVIITNLEFSIQSWNDAATQLYGWTAQEVIGRHIAEILPVVRYLNGQDSEAAINDLEHNKFWRGEVIQRCHDKSERVISSSVQVLRDAKDQPQAYIAINRDISAHKKSEDALWHYAERLNILHHMNQRTLAGHPLELIAEEVLNRLRRLVAVDQASVLLYNADMSSGTVLGISGATPDWPAVGEVINLHSFMPGVITRIRHPHIFHDIAAPSVQKQFDIPPEIASMALKMGIRAVLSIPLTVNGMLIGSLNLSTSAPQSFPDDHVIIARE
ncbi:MAG: PAS domain S-box protein, partial [Oscillochloris sp.]|nr:PAS domain S-box protein [Oscillochloris sp.]